MRNLKFYLLGLLAGLGCMSVHAQIGYQIALLNTATGEARANETVNVSVSLSNNEGQVFYTETKSATTNDFGVLSLSIGNADTFTNVDFSKIPFFIEVTANGVSIGKSQILNVPIAEYAKRTGTLTKELLVGTWICEIDFTYKTYDNTNCIVSIRKQFVFNEDGTAKLLESSNGDSYEYNYSWQIDGNVKLFSLDINPNLKRANPTFTYTSSPFVIFGGASTMDYDAKNKVLYYESRIFTKK